MNGKQLKNSILQWAIQGKLVPQDPNDEPASVLLERIREEKKRLVKEKKIKKDKNESIIYRGEDNSYYEKILATGEVKCIDEEIPFEIPEGWEWCRLSSIVSLLGDGIHGTPIYDDSGDVFFINGNNLSDGNIMIKGNTKKVSEIESQKHLRELNNRSVLVSINGTIGNIAFYNNEPVILGKSACYFNLLNEIEKEYIKIVIETDYFKKYAKKVATGSTIKNVPLSGMRNLLIPLPSCNQQINIVNHVKLLKPYIDRYDKLQLSLEQLNSTLNDRLRKSILQEAIQGKLVPQIASEGTAKELIEQIKAEKEKLVKEGKLKKSALTDSTIFKDEDGKYYEKKGKEVTCIDEEIPFEIPDSWEWCRFNVIGSSELGKTLNRAKDKGELCEYLCSINIYWEGVNTTTIKSAYFTESEKKKYVLEKGDLLICEGGDIGRSAIWNKSEKMYYQNALHRVRLEKGISNEYILNLLFFYKTVGILDKVSKGMTIKHFTKASLNSLLYPIPPLSEQHRIVEKINELFDKLI